MGAVVTWRQPGQEAQPPEMIEEGPFRAFQRSHYGLILCDPPWYFKSYSAKGDGKNPNQHYDCMSLADIQALPVAALAARDCALVMWATAPMLPQALDTMRLWGFQYKSGGTWAKQTKTGNKWMFGTGYCYRSAVEYFLLGTRGKPRQLVRDVRNLIVAPVREHSRKPDEMRETLERLWPGPRIELFARQSAPGWSSWGNQVTKFDQTVTQQDNRLTA